MFENWDDAIVTQINVAMFVAPGTGVANHTNRAFHGFVFNDKDSDKKIYFSDGTVLSTGPLEFHYLPKGSNYRVETITKGGCWAINFALLTDIPQQPFSLSFRNHEQILRLFKDAVGAWKNQSDSCNAIIRKSIYDLILCVQKEHARNYLPSKKELLIQPAVDIINRDFTNNDLSVKVLADACQISQAYFRRVFADRFSVSPKDYIINLRMEYAKRLLQSAQFSVGEVAQMCGYFEPCHFSREFSRHTGVSPKVYSRTNKAGG